MNVCVLGLWHLGSVTAACMASAGHRVIGLDFDGSTIEGLRAGKPPIFEPGLEELIRGGIAGGNLIFTSNAEQALDKAEILWIAYDTPVDEDDRADVDFVFNEAVRAFPFIQSGCLVLVSSQLPLGTTARLERAFVGAFPDKNVSFGYSPENLRLGKALDAFLKPDRVVAGLRRSEDREKVAELFRPITTNLEWMSVESAEMTKHALNAFLATSVAFINEVASLCESYGADAFEVQRGLKTDVRIGPRAYLSPGAAFAGGTLARDIAFLSELGMNCGRPTHLLSSVRTSNEAHKQWPRRKLSEVVGSLAGKKIAVWGLTYKPGTDTLRRSSSVELCRWLAGERAEVQAHDFAVKELPAELRATMKLAATPLDALKDASALVVATPWPEYRAVETGASIEAMASPVVIDPDRFLNASLGADPCVRYYTVGRRSL